MIKRNIFIDINQIKNPFINQQLIFENWMEWSQIV
jgi:hypothetical protein